MRNLKIRCLLMLSLTAMIGCASTVVKKDPGQHDRGVRYYRPKPYLLITPGGEKGDNGNIYKLALEYLPDYSEEYSIHIRAGVGTNKTEVTLANGWNLTGINVDVDSKFNENVTALTGLAKTALGVGSGPTMPAVGVKQVGDVVGSNVPLGYYEAVISCGPDGKKRMCGWRYVGFMPFAGCHVEAMDTQCPNGGDGQLYALVCEKNLMVFKPVGLAAAPQNFKKPE